MSPFKTCLNNCNVIKICKSCSSKIPLFQIIISVYKTINCSALLLLLQLFSDLFSVFQRNIFLHLQSSVLEVVCIFCTGQSRVAVHKPLITRTSLPSPYSTWVHVFSVHQENSTGLNDWSLHWGGAVGLFCCGKHSAGMIQVHILREGALQINTKVFWYPMMEQLSWWESLPGWQCLCPQGKRGHWMLWWVRKMMLIMCCSLCN